MSFVKVPKIPLTNYTLRLFIGSIARNIQSNNQMCPGYSVVADPSGRILVSATFESIDAGPYTMSMEIAPVADPLE